MQSLQNYLVTHFWLVLIAGLVLGLLWAMLVWFNRPRTVATRPRNSLLDDTVTPGAYQFGLFDGSVKPQKRKTPWWYFLPLLLLLLFFVWLAGKRNVPPPEIVKVPVPTPASAASAASGTVLDTKLADAGASADAARVREMGRLLGIRGRYDDLAATWPHYYTADKNKKLINDTSPVPADLDSYDVVLMGCPGEVSAEWRQALQKYVRRGGYLIASCWALPKFIEPTFPGYIKAGQMYTKSDKSVSAKIAAASSPFLHGAAAQKLNRWTIGHSNYFIHVTDPRVQKLLTSPEIGPVDDALVAAFPYGEGWVLFTASEVKLQKSTGASDFFAAVYIVTNALDAAVKQHNKS